MLSVNFEKQVMTLQYQLMNEFFNFKEFENNMLMEF